VPSPPLEWFDVPDETAELALVCEDPDLDEGADAATVRTAAAGKELAVGELVRTYERTG
jgi:phosphatidylethanolamine-binding protein (PEBP) family uncharacterized protein